jgi:glycosyltransferase involved in cell wall biosynthesis
MKRLVLFFDLYDSLRREEEWGLLLREMAPFERLLENGSFDEVCCFTYDDRDHDKLAELKRNKAIANNVTVLTPPRMLRSPAGAVVYSIVGPFLHYRTIAQATVLRTQQVSGAWTALIARLSTGTPLLFRLGYPLSIRFKTEGKRLKHFIALAVEWLLVRFADRVAVTSRAMQTYYGRMSPCARIEVLPSYVDIGGFSPIGTYDAARPILFVGRLAPVKNVASLILACSRLKISLHIYGVGPLKDDLEQQARTCGAAVVFSGVVPNSELARIHHDHTIYVLCSTREGMPKSMIEAMASGLICVSTPTDGARELIEDGRTGYLTDGFDADAIERKLREVLDAIDPEVGHRASAIVRENNSLERAVEMEGAILDGIARDHRAPATAQTD